jgi:hypothetical protein
MEGLLLHGDSMAERTELIIWNGFELLAIVQLFLMLNLSIPSTSSGCQIYAK